MSQLLAVESQTSVKSAFTPVANGVLQRAAINPAPVQAVPPIVHEVIRSSGQPLDVATRSFMEPRFGHDFSGCEFIQMLKQPNRRGQLMP